MDRESERRDAQARAVRSAIPHQKLRLKDILAELYQMENTPDEGEMVTVDLPLAQIEEIIS